MSRINTGSFGRYLTRSEDLNHVFHSCIRVLDRIGLDYRRIGPKEGTFSLRGYVYHRGLAVVRGILSVLVRGGGGNIVDPKVRFEIECRHLESTSHPRPSLTLGVYPVGCDSVRYPMLGEAPYIEIHGKSGHADKWFKLIAEGLMSTRVVMA